MKRASIKLRNSIENWWTSDFLAFTKRLQADFYIQAVEASEVLALNKTNLENLSDMSKIKTMTPYGYQLFKQDKPILERFERI
jgi:hypothetical protein